MGRPLNNDDFIMLEETFDNMKHLSTKQKILVFLPSIILTSFILYHYYKIINHMSV